MLLELEVEHVKGLSNWFVVLEVQAGEVWVTESLFSRNSLGGLEHHELSQEVQSLRRVAAEHFFECFSCSFWQSFDEFLAFLRDLLDILDIWSAEVLAYQLDLALCVGSRQERLSS